MTTPEQILRSQLSKLGKEELIERLLAKDHSLSPSAPPPTKKQKRQFEFSKHVQRRIALKISYIGWDYDGFAYQTTNDNTIEYHLFEALKKCKMINDIDSADYSRCGRTDKGVSSHGQVVALNVRSKLPFNHPLAILHPDFNIQDASVVESLAFDPVQNGYNDGSDDEYPYCVMLNNILPKEIRVLSWCGVDNKFSARFTCSFRKYRYFFPKGQLDIRRMHDAAQYLLGEHDFRNFCKIDKSKGAAQAFTRRILDVGIEKYDTFRDDDDPLCMYTFNVKGTAFLLNMVRCTMAILQMIGTGSEDVSLVRELLDIEKNPQKPVYKLADPYGLVLWECGYGDGQLDFIDDSKNWLKVHEGTHNSWKLHNTKSTILRGLFDDLMISGHCASASPAVDEGAENNFMSKKIYVPILERPFSHDESVEDRLSRFEQKKRAKLAAKHGIDNGK